MNVKTGDGNILGAHSENLGALSRSFPQPAAVPGASLPVTTVNEDSDVVELMLKFMHYMPFPDLSELPIDLLTRLADAAEKYEIYSAMSTCRSEMR
jgi:hypothetical protein